MTHDRALLIQSRALVKPKQGSFDARERFCQNLGFFAKYMGENMRLFELNTEVFLVEYRGLLKKNVAHLLHDRALRAVNLLESIECRTHPQPTAGVDPSTFIIGTNQKLKT